MIKTIVASLAVCGFLFAGSENMVPSFSDFDANRDGKISKAEFESAQEHRMKNQSESGKMMKNINNQLSFENLDINQDTFVDTTEFSEHQAKHRAKMRAAQN